ncbi:HSR-9 protein [Aphelenchoides avenae]|nr:HSR-9 protein [Aphelenchus avenae]
MSSSACTTVGKDETFELVQAIAQMASQNRTHEAVCKQEAGATSSSARGMKRVRSSAITHASQLFEEPPRLLPEQQVIADHPLAGQKFIPGARVYAYFNSSGAYYPAVVCGIDQEDADGRYVVYFCIEKIHRRVAFDGIVAISQIVPGLKASMSKVSADPDESTEEYEVQVVATPARDSADDWMTCKFTVKELEGTESFSVPWDELFWDSIGLRPVKKELMRRANVDSVNIVPSCRVRRVNTGLAKVWLPPKPKKARMKKEMVAVKENRTKDFGRPNYTDESEKTFIFASHKHKGTTFTFNFAFKKLDSVYYHCVQCLSLAASPRWFRNISGSVVVRDGRLGCDPDKPVYYSDHLCQGGRPYYGHGEARLAAGNGRRIKKEVVQVGVPYSQVQREAGQHVHEEPAARANEQQAAVQPTMPPVQPEVSFGVALPGRNDGEICYRSEFYMGHVFTFKFLSEHRTADAVRRMYACVACTQALAGRLPVPIITHNERIIQRDPDCPLGEPHRCMQGTSRSIH